MKESPYLKLCHEVIDCAVFDYVYWKKATAREKGLTKWRLREQDGKSAEEFFKSDFNFYFYFLGLNKERFLAELCEREGIED